MYAANVLCDIVCIWKKIYQIHVFYHFSCLFFFYILLPDYSRSPNLLNVKISLAYFLKPIFFCFSNALRKVICLSLKDRFSLPLAFCFNIMKFFLLFSRFVILALGFWHLGFLDGFSRSARPVISLSFHEIY